MINVVESLEDYKRTYQNFNQIHLNLNAKANGLKLQMLETETSCNQKNKQIKRLNSINRQFI